MTDNLKTTGTLSGARADRETGFTNTPGQRYRQALSCSMIVGLWIALVFGLSVLSACGQAVKKPDSQPPVAITPDDSCAVCGMQIVLYPGPRAEAYLVGQAQPLKFGGTSDFFAFVLQPEYAHRLGALYVQDMAVTDWQHPSNDASTFTNARTAWYVADQPLPGEMGPTLASFRRREDAETFIRHHGGRLLRFQDITPDLISHLTEPHAP